MNKLQQIQPTVTVKLEPDEKVYAEYKAFRAGDVDAFKNKTAGIGTSVAGIGVGLAGGTSVASKKFQTVSSGQLLLTNKRMILIGKSFVQIPYDSINVISFKKASQVAKYKWQRLWMKTTNNPFSQYSIPTIRKTVIMTVLYDGGLDNEQYMITSKNARDIEAAYRAVTAK